MKTEHLVLTHTDADLNLGTFSAIYKDHLLRPRCVSDSRLSARASPETGTFSENGHNHRSPQAAQRRGRGAAGDGRLLVSWHLIHTMWYSRDHFWDTVEYARYAHDILVRGLLPYRGFALEYPPLSLVTFVPPSVIAGHSFHVYMVVFSAMMGVCGMLIVAAVAVALGEEQVGPGRTDRSDRVRRGEPAAVSERCCYPATTCSRRC